MNMLTFNYIGFVINLLGTATCVGAFVLNMMAGQHILAVVMALFVGLNSYCAVNTIKRIDALQDKE